MNLRNGRIIVEHSSQRAEAAVAPQVSGQLCERCAAIKLEKVLQQTVKKPNGLFVTDLESVEELKASDCVLCQLFGSMSPSDFDKDGSKRSGRCHLRVFSASRAFTGLSTRKMRNRNDINLLGIVRINVSQANNGQGNSRFLIWDSLQETGYLHLLQAGLSQSVFDVRLVSPHSVNVDFVTYCIEYCLTNHRKTCNPSTVMPATSLRLIDCHTRVIVKAPLECQYVALSYIWGHSETSSITTTEPNDTQFTLQNAPKVINDSIEMTLKLQLRYLWVDRYCIDQLNKIEKHAQILQMDSIYARAHLTLIAAAGRDPEYGLPGVQGTLRSIQPQQEIGRDFLVSTLPWPKLKISTSKWASRGWTYQEDVLSTRRLFFTDEQVFYQCNGMHCAESLVLPLDEMHSKSNEAFTSDVPGKAYHDRVPGKKPWEVMAYVAQFNQRDLKFPADALDAMQGVFGFFRSSLRPVHQLLGVPILPPVAALRNGTVYKATSRSTEECFIIGLSWSHICPSKRREEFPSWTWAGWLGNISPTFQIDESSLYKLENVTVWIELDGGSLVRLPTWDNLSSFLSQDFRLTRFLHIEAITVTFSIVYLLRDSVLANCSDRHYSWIEEHTIGQDGYWAEFQLDQDASYYFEIRMDRNIKDDDLAGAQLMGRSWPGYVGIFLDGPTNEQSDATVLVVHETGSYAERLAIFCTTQTRRLVRRSGTWSYLQFTEIMQGWLSNQPSERRNIKLG